MSVRMFNNNNTYIYSHHSQTKPIQIYMLSYSILGSITIGWWNWVSKFALALEMCAYPHIYELTVKTHIATYTYTETLQTFMYDYYHM